MNEMKTFTYLEFFRRKFQKLNFPDMIFKAHFKLVSLNESKIHTPITKVQMALKRLFA